VDERGASGVANAASEGNNDQAGGANNVGEGDAGGGNNNVVGGGDNNEAIEGSANNVDEGGTNVDDGNSGAGEEITCIADDATGIIGTTMNTCNLLMKSTPRSSDVPFNADSFRYPTPTQPSFHSPKCG
jgi:hypothetical protein